MDTSVIEIIRIQVRELMMFLDPMRRGQVLNPGELRARVLDLARAARLVEMESSTRFARELKQIARKITPHPNGKDLRSFVTQIVATCDRFVPQVHSDVSEYEVVSLSSGVHISPAGSPRDTTFSVGAEIASTNVVAFNELPPSLTPRFERRQLAARAPSIVGIDEVFVVAARIDVKPSDESSAPLDPIAIPASGLRITLTVINEPDGKIELLSEQSVEVLVHAGSPSGDVVFRFKAVARGGARLVIRAFSEQAYIGDLRINLEVSAKGVNAPQDVGTVVMARRPSTLDATLEIAYQRNQQTYAFTLRGGGGIGINKYARQLDNNPGDFVVGIMTQLNELARRTNKPTVEGIEATLSGIGNDLWSRLLPDPLKDKLVKHWSDIDRLTLIAEDDPLPWELLYCARKDSFVADQWILCRWCYGDPAPVEVGRGPSRYVLPSAAPDAAVEEVRAVQKLFPGDDVWATLKELLNGLNEADMGLLHIAAHNIIDYDNAQASYLKLDDRFMPSMLGKYQEYGRLQNSPLIFLNACSSAGAADQWVGSTSWASKFLLAGAGAFVGSLWEVRDGPASAFALSFYKSTRQGRNLGEAFRAARAAIAETGDPTRFAYTFFGDPDAVFNERG